MRVLLLLSCVAALAAALPAAAQPAEMPAEMPAESPAPAPQREAAPAASTGVVEAPGMAIIGDRESPIGLYIMPWRNSAAESGLDRPARLLDDALLPLDPQVFRRQVEYHRALSEHLNKTGRTAP